MGAGGEEQAVLNAAPVDVALADQVARLPWYHRMRLPGGVLTPGVVDVERIVHRLDLPTSLADRSVLDIGAWDGFYAFECARRGATRVLATDSFSWDGSGWGDKAAFLLARRALDLEDTVDDQTIDVMDVRPEIIGGTFDVVLLLGVLYHLRDPITALERAASVCDDLLIIETETALNALPWPAARVYPGRELNNDDTNWYAYNARALRGLLSQVGFTNCRVAWRSSIPRRIAATAISARRQPSLASLSRLRSARIVIHARRGS